MPPYQTQCNLRVMALGDSITLGTHSHLLGGYRVPLWEAAQRAGWSFEFVGSLEDGPPECRARSHEGHYGWTIPQLNDEVAAWVACSVPNIVLVHAGTNDIVGGARPADIAMCCDQLMRRIAQEVPDALQLVAQITPIGYATLDARVQEYNALIATLVHHHAARGIKCCSVNMYAAVAQSSLADKIHPNDAGYAAMAQVWYHAIAQCTGA